MEEAKQELIEDLVGVIAKLGIEALNVAETKMHYHRQLLEADREKKCHPGEIWNGTKCVPDIG